MEDKVKEIMADVFVCDINSITTTTTHADLENWDSLQHLIFVSKLEQELQVSFTPEEINAMLSYNDILGALRFKRKGEAEER